MFDQTTIDILTLLATAVLADKILIEKEIDVFVTSSKTICSDIDVKPAPSEARLINWFEMNKDMIQSKLNQADFETWFINLTRRLRKLPNISKLLAEIETIAKSDDEFHISEKAYLVLVDKHLRRA